MHVMSLFSTLSCHTHECLEWGTAEMFWENIHKFHHVGSYFFAVITEDHQSMEHIGMVNISGNFRVM